MAVKTTPGDLHAGEPQLENPVSEATETALDGKSPEELAALKTSMDSVSACQVEALKLNVKKRISIPKNLAALSFPKIKIPRPSVDLPDVPGISKVGDISRNFELQLGKVKTPDIQSVRKSISLCGIAAAGEKSVSEFEKNKSELVSGKIAQQSTDITRRLADVNGMRSAISRRLGA